MVDVDVEVKVMEVMSVSVRRGSRLLVSRRVMLERPGWCDD